VSFFKKNFKLPKLNNLENYSKKIMTTINEQAKNIVNEIRNEGNKSKKGQSLEEQFPYPWSDEIDEETVKNAIVALSLDVRNFLISPGENFYFNLNDNLHYAINLLKFDKRLDILRYNIVPKQIKEDEFWKNYFYRISLIKSGQDIKTLPDIFLPEEIPKAEEPEELKKKASEELFSTFVFDKDEEEELLKDFEKEIGGAIHFEDIRYKTPNPANNNVNANPTYEKINTEEFNSGVNGDINSFNAISTKELDSKIEIENDKPNQAAKTNNSATNEAINIITRTDLESEDDLSIVKRHKRALTPYNQFMKQEITKIKAKQPNITHKAAFTEAAQRWKISLNNPKNNSINEAINIISNKDLESEDDLLIVNKPKRALTPYNQFMKQELTKIKAEQPNITHKAAFTEAAQRWKVSLNNPKYNTTDEAINNIGKTNLESEDDLLIVKKPKRALTPYNQFMKQELTKIKAKQPNITHKAAFTEAAQRWKISLNNPKNNTINEVINIISKTDLESVDDLSRVKKHKRALTPYNQFMKQEITKIKAKQPNITHKAAFKEAAQRWIVSLNNSKNNAFDKAINIINKTDLESEDDLSGVKKHKRALTPYNQFLKQELTKIKAEQPNITHKAAFTEAAQRWKVSLNNPKNNSIDEAINNISRTDLESEDDLSRVKRQKRALTPYNQFMKQEITKIKAKQPNITHKAAFKEAAQRWMISLNNPKKNTTNGAINIITKIGLESEDELSRVKKHKRALTPYNQFMKQEITKIKAEQPNITHKAAFTEAAQRVSDNKNLF
jgi:ethanolamine utilization protein EutP (predicted NTPase)